MGTEKEFDLFVIGGGSGGVRAARIAASHGARVAIAEEYRYGGTCVIRGCVPKKLLVYAASVRHELDDAAGYGWQLGDARFDWATLIANKDREIDRLEGIYGKLLGDAGVTTFARRAVLADRHTLRVGGEEVRAGTILVATGGHPQLPHVPGIEHAITSNEAFHLPALPARITVIGGGYIAVEFAHVFAALGARTALVHRRQRMLRGFDEDVRRAITDNLRDAGIHLHLGAELDCLERGAPDGPITVTLTTGERFETDAVMCATGRVPNTRHMGLENVGVRLDALGAVVVDEYSRSTVDNIYAVGDCTNRVNLTPVAIREGHAFADTVFGGKPQALDHHCIPTAVFAQPEAASVGLTEAEARAAGPVDVYRTEFRPLKNTLSGRATKTLIKLLVHAETDRVLGVHMVGPAASEIIQVAAISVRMGATKADFDATVALHPTTAEELVLLRRKAA